MKQRTTPALPREAFLRLALEAQCDPRTVAKALANGIDSLRPGFARDRLRRALERHGFLPDPAAPAGPGGRP
jgi:hypothetical protein